MCIMILNEVSLVNYAQRSGGMRSGGHKDMKFGLRTQR